MTATTDRPYRQGVGIMLINQEGLVFVGQRIDTPGAWQMPQGGIDRGEEPEDAAYRELEEEIGTNAADLLGETEDWLRYDLPPDVQKKVWKGKYRGQEQKWYVMRLAGPDALIDIETDHPEFDAWKWVPLDQLIELIVPFKRALYTDVVAALGAYVKPV
ncbi:MAG: RNA pyrophosphohydrolase [Rhodospirillum sp.]|nr:RNA pyrophosphohydrolase [Rhodospirillum sp.]MCF8491890.1 RNA pyrophosphohydrolase [Rhodospirillum sp.]MCF8502014.1 RNA pyrophosphohydrolase [Rhodospirillum sp.]